MYRIHWRGSLRFGPIFHQAFLRRCLMARRGLRGLSERIVLGLFDLRVIDIHAVDFINVGVVLAFNSISVTDTAQNLRGSCFGWGLFLRWP